MVGVYAHSPRTIIARTSYSYEFPSSLSGGSVGKVLSGNFTFLGIQPESAQGVVETDASLDPAKTDDRDALADEEVRSGKANDSVAYSGSDVPKELAQDQDKAVPEKARWENVQNVEIAQSRGNEDVGLTNDLTDGESVGAKAEAEQTTTQGVDKAASTA